MTKILLKPSLLMSTNVMDSIDVKKTVLLATCFLMIAFDINAESSFCFFSKDDTYQKYQCMASCAGNQSPIGCSLLCFQQSRCIGVIYDTVSSECLLVNRTEKTGNCSYSYSSTWRTYRKRREIGIGTCNSYLMNTDGYHSIKGGDGNSFGNRALLNYVPSSSEEIGGVTLSITPGSPPNEWRSVIVTLKRKSTVIGVATQGRWRNDSLDTCCDERVTAFMMRYYDNGWYENYNEFGKWMFEGNVIPDAGNEIVVNFFERPITTSYIIIYEFYNNAHHLSPTIRFDFIGC